MNVGLKESINAANLEFKEEPMDDYYNNLIAGFPSRIRVKKIIKELGDLRGKNVLDVGCEAGYVSLKILEKKPSALYAFDICEEALESFRRKLQVKRFSSDITLKKAFMHKTPFKKDLFDAVVCTEVIEHAAELDKDFKELNRIMKKGAKLIITFPNECLRKKIYPIVKLFGINTDVEKQVTLFEYHTKDILFKLKKYFRIRKIYSLPRLFPITYFIICEKQ